MLAFGHNDNGQLGLGDYDNRNKPTLVMKDKTIQQIVCGAYHTLILKETGELFAFGNNGFKQLGLDNNRENKNKPTLLMKDKSIQQIICGSCHSFILKNSGELFATGRIGLGDCVNRDTPTLVMKNNNILLINEYKIK